MQRQHLAAVNLMAGASGKDNTFECHNGRSTLDYIMIPEYLQKNVLACQVGGGGGGGGGCTMTLILLIISRYQWSYTLGCFPGLFLPQSARKESDGTSGANKVGAGVSDTVRSKPEGSRL